MPRCSWSLCNSDSRYDKNSKKPRPSMIGVKFISFSQIKVKVRTL